jgi:hypothetical protein
MMPVVVVVGPITYRVTHSVGDWMRVEHETLTKGYYGHTDNMLATIYINPDSPPDVARLSLWHEVMHAMCAAFLGGNTHWQGLGKGKTQGDREESVIRVLESPIVCVLRDNPALVAYLLAA